MTAYTVFRVGDVKSLLVSPGPHKYSFPVFCENFSAVFGSPFPPVSIVAAFPLRNQSVLISAQSVSPVPPAPACRGACRGLVVRFLVVLAMLYIRGENSGCVSHAKLEKDGVCAAPQSC